MPAAVVEEIGFGRIEAEAIHDAAEGRKVGGYISAHLGGADLGGADLGGAVGAQSKRTEHQDEPHPSIPEQSRAIKGNQGPSLSAPDAWTAPLMAAAALMGAVGSDNLGVGDQGGGQGGQEGGQGGAGADAIARRRRVSMRWDEGNWDEDNWEETADVGGCGSPGSRGAGGGGRGAAGGGESGSESGGQLSGGAGMPHDGQAIGACKEPGAKGAHLPPCAERPRPTPRHRGQRLFMALLALTVAVALIAHLLTVLPPHALEPPKDRIGRASAANWSHPSRLRRLRLTLGQTLGRTFGGLLHRTRGLS